MARPSPSGHHEFQGIPWDLGQRPTSLAQKAAFRATREPPPWSCRSPVRSSPRSTSAERRKHGEATLWGGRALISGPVLQIAHCDTPVSKPTPSLAGDCESGGRMEQRGTADGTPTPCLCKRPRQDGVAARILLVRTRRATGSEPGARIVYLSGNDGGPVRGSPSETGDVMGVGPRSAGAWWRALEACGRGRARCAQREAHRRAVGPGRAAPAATGSRWRRARRP